MKRHSVTWRGSSAKSLPILRGWGAIAALHAALRERVFAAVGLSGELSQRERSDALQALRDGPIDALVVQDPVRMGELGVRTAVATIRAVMKGGSFKCVGRDMRYRPLRSWDCDETARGG